MIRRHGLHDRWPATFPPGQGSDLAGIIAEVGAGIKAWKAGDKVLGFTYQRASQAEFVFVPANQRCTWVRAVTDLWYLLPELHSTSLRA